MCQAAEPEAGNSGSALPGELGGVRCDGGEGVQGPLQQQSNSASQELVAAGGHTQGVIPDTVGGALLTQHPGKC